MQVFSKKPLATNQSTTFSCFDLAGANAVLANCLGADLKMRVVVPGGLGKIGPGTALWGRRGGVGGRLRFGAGARELAPPFHAFNVVGDGPTNAAHLLVYDVLYHPRPRPDDTDVIGGFLNHDYFAIVFPDMADKRVLDPQRFLTLIRDAVTIPEVALDVVPPAEKQDRGGK